MITRTVRDPAAGLRGHRAARGDLRRVHYAGIGTSLFGPAAARSTPNFPDSGGIFTGAEVTYRGVTVGRVGELHLLEQNGQSASGSSCDSRTARTRPSWSTARPPSRTDRRSASSTSTSSPRADGGAYLTTGAVLAKPVVPVATQVLLSNLDELVATSTPTSSTPWSASWATPSTAAARPCRRCSTRAICCWRRPSTPAPDPRSDRRRPSC